MKVTQDAAMLESRRRQNQINESHARDQRQMLERQSEWMRWATSLLSLVREIYGVSGIIKDVANLYLSKTKEEAHAEMWKNVTTEVKRHVHEVYSRRTPEEQKRMTQGIAKIGEKAGQSSAEIDRVKTEIGKEVTYTERESFHQSIGTVELEQMTTNAVVELMQKNGNDGGKNLTAEKVLAHLQTKLQDTNLGEQERAKIQMLCSHMEFAKADFEVNFKQAYNEWLVGTLQKNAGDDSAADVHDNEYSKAVEHLDYLDGDSLEFCFIQPDGETAPTQLAFRIKTDKNVADKMRTASNMEQRDSSTVILKTIPFNADGIDDPAKLTTPDKLEKAVTTVNTVASPEKQTPERVNAQSSAPESDHELLALISQMIAQGNTKVIPNQWQHMMGKPEILHAILYMLRSSKDMYRTQTQAQQKSQQPDSAARTM